MASTDNSGKRLRLTYDTELIQNYIQGEIVSPKNKFEALQTKDGHTLLFGVDSSNIFHVIEESSGKHSTGWALSDLSTAAISSQLPGKKDTMVRTFDVGQSVLDQTIGMAMAVRVEGKDHLFVSLKNSNSDTSWIKNPEWTLVPFDAANETQSSITVVGIWFAETDSQKQYLVVDIDRSGSSTMKDIARYYVDPSITSGSRWVKHDVPVDIAAGYYQSCIGRVHRGRIDGIYTTGTSGGSPQLDYVPLENIFGDGPPLPTRFKLPDNKIPSAIATARKENGETDLYMLSGETLYRIAAEKQTDDATADAVLTNSLLSGTGVLRAMIHQEVLTLFGKNGSDQVYCLSCNIEKVADQRAWNVPVPISNGVEQISAYVNRADGGNTIFTSGGGRLGKITQDINTLWKSQNIKLAPSSTTEKALVFKSYTTFIHVMDDNELAASGATLKVSTASRTPVYINGLYYVLGQSPIEVKADRTGLMTVIEETPNINGATLTVSTDGGRTRTAINPMNKSFEKLGKLDSKDSLRDASFPSETPGGGVVGTPKKSPLVEQSTKDSDLDKVAANMAGLNKAYSHVKTAKPAGRSLHGNLRAISSGDFEVIWHEATQAWHFVVTIAGDIYRAILDTVEAVIAAVEWIFNAIKTAIKAIIQFIEFLFEWDDIKRTKNVLYNISKQFFQHQIDSIGDAKSTFNNKIESVEKSLNEWADVDWSPLGDSMSKPASSSSKSNSQNQTPGSQLLVHHYKNNANSVSVVADSPFSGDINKDPAQRALNDLHSALSKEDKVISGFRDQIGEVAKQFATMTIEDAIKKIVAILVDGILASVEVVVDALLDLLQDLATAVVGMVDAKLHIPIISDILNAIGIPDISFLDLFTWVAAVCYTVVYKIAKGEPPFPDNKDVQSVIDASSWNDLINKLHPPAASSVASSALYAMPVSGLASASAMTPSSKPTVLQDVIFITGHSVSGICGVLGAFVNAAEAEFPTGDNPMSTPSAILGFIGAASEAVADIVSPKDPLEEPIFSALSTATSVTTAVSKIVFSSYGQKRLSRLGLPTAEDPRGMGAGINVLLVGVGAATTIKHFVELAKDPAGKDRSAAIVGEVSNLTSYISRISYALAVNDIEEDTRQVVIAVMTVSNLITAGLQIAEAIVD
ncbi:hypothetical protein ANOM_003381 [Aspergillus nomiae NRRL 13137]|uniref:Uncharacterized protein n=1 Tax=Aspergillus nomiae NRRL (strain ATCC 15546 / NRRL 13137 / CBS 260.88 / M93) TaxID=1509407 RepID=A0A0L1J9M7_ASPN3|nr:uncharacterized protein ANOM_003381 [Aspergillus nomiae NRRL 13137]KNG88148.1 hypothetical protein ANOM_003381 [Aspergillus nomiae NRRL 13137]